jgi:hypothetical protein
MKSALMWKSLDSKWEFRGGKSDAILMHKIVSRKSFASLRFDANANEVQEQRIVGLPNCGLLLHFPGHDASSTPIFSIRFSLKSAAAPSNGDENFVQTHTVAAVLITYLIAFTGRLRYRSHMKSELCDGDGNYTLDTMNIADSYAYLPIISTLQWRYQSFTPALHQLHPRCRYKLRAHAAWSSG